MQTQAKTKQVGHTRAKRTTVHVYFTRDVFDKIKSIAGKSGLTASAWVRMQALIEAEKN